MTIADYLSGACPSHEHLCALHAGRLPAESLEVIAAHIDNCAPCTSLLDRLREPDDPLMAELRQPTPPDPWAESESGRVAALIDRIELRSPPAAPAPPGPAPERLGQYEIVGRLGEGGMGEVLRA